MIRGHEVLTATEDFNTVRDALEGQFGAPEEAGLTWKAQNATPVDEDQAQTLLKLLNALDDLDDVQSVSSNFEIDDEIMAKLAV